jgi:fructokinase
VGALSYGTTESPVPGLARHGGYDVDVVDTTGAGDVLLAAFVAALPTGVTDGTRALALANAAGAVAATQPGAVTALTGLDRVADSVAGVPWN